MLLEEMEELLREYETELQDIKDHLMEMVDGENFLDMQKESQRRFKGKMSGLFCDSLQALAYDGYKNSVVQSLNYVESIDNRELNIGSIEVKENKNYLKKRITSLKNEIDELKYRITILRQFEMR